LSPQFSEKEYTLADYYDQFRGLPSQGVIKALVGDQASCDRLLEVGFAVGETYEIHGVSPFKGPLIVQVGTAVLAIREMEALCVQVQI
jgi:Fe2+ transport system protein FeoA